MMKKTHPLTDKKYFVPFLFVTSLFFLWGFARAILDVLNKHFQDVLNISITQSAYIQVMTYLGYFITALPAGIYINKYGYRKGVVTGLMMYATGAFLFVPGMRMGSFSVFLIALFVIGCGLTFKQDLKNNRDAEVAISKLCEKFGSRLREIRKNAKGISVVVRDNNLNWKEWQTSLPYPSSSPRTIADAATKLFLSKYSWSAPIRSITVRAIRLVSEDEPVQISFFNEIQTEIRNTKLDSAMETLKNRFGNGIIKPASFLDMSYLPESVVFSSLPPAPNQYV